jgi:hypothetical protein
MCVSLLVPQKKGNELNLAMGQIVLQLFQWVGHTPGSVLFLPIIVMHVFSKTIFGGLYSMFSKARVVVTLMVCCNCVRFYRPDNSHFNEGFLDFNDTTQHLSLVHLYIIFQTIGCGTKHREILQLCNVLMLLEHLFNGEFLAPLATLHSRTQIVELSITGRMLIKRNVPLVPDLLYIYFQARDPSCMQLNQVSCSS